MSDSTRECFGTLNKVLLRSWIIGIVIMLVSTIILLASGDLIDVIHGRIFGLTPHELDLIIYCGLGVMKLLVLVLFFIPWLAIKMVLGKVA